MANQRPFAAALVALLIFQLGGSLLELAVCATAPMDEAPARCANNEQVVFEALVLGERLYRTVTGLPPLAPHEEVRPQAPADGWQRPAAPPTAIAK